MVLEYKGYVIAQAVNNHIHLCKDGQLIMHEACDKRLSLKEMHEKVDAYEDMVKQVKEGRSLDEIFTKKLLKK